MNCASNNFELKRTEGSELNVIILCSLKADGVTGFPGSGSQMNYSSFLRSLCFLLLKIN